MQSFNTTSIYHDNLILNICLDSGQQTEKLGNTEIYEKIIDPKSFHREQSNKHNSPRGCRDQQQPGKSFIQCDPFYMHILFYPVNG